MAKLNTYLNFAGNTEEAFEFYKQIFGGEFTSLVRFKDMPMEGVNIPEADQNKIMHIALPIGKESVLMGTDSLESLGMKLVQGNNVYISIHPDTKEEADRIFKALSSGGVVEMPIADQPWGDYYGSFKDKFGMMWMVNYGYLKEKTKDEETTITVEDEIEAPVAKVWRFWTDPEHIKNWYHASDDWYVPGAENDLRVGGKFKTQMAARDGSEGFDLTGTYTQISKNKLIEFKLDDGRKVKVNFTCLGKSKATKVTEEFEPEHTYTPEMQRNGWQAILNNFKEYAEAHR